MNDSNHSYNRRYRSNFSNELNNQDYKLFGMTIITSTTWVLYVVKMVFVATFSANIASGCKWVASNICGRRL